MKYLRRFGIFLLLIVILPGVIAPALYICDMNVNRGYTFGYWGDYNRASNALTAMPSVKVTRSWYDEDLSIEIFSFALIVDDRPLQLDFPSFDPIRQLSGEELTKAMEVRVREEFVERYSR